MTEVNPAAQPIEIAAVSPMPLRINRLSICDFRAFPHPVTFNLAAKNMLVYGENGAGKSTIFQALRYFFTTQAPPISSVKNVFSSRPDTDFRVEVMFNDGSPSVPWSSTRHPARLPNTDARVVETALRKSCLDYRALLDTNYIHGTKRPNLFDISVSLLLADFPVPTAGGAVKTISELWADIDRAKPWNYNISLEQIQKACVAFNEGFRLALEALHPRLVELVQTMLGASVEVKPFQFGGVTYQHNWWKRDRIIKGRELFPEIVFNGKDLLTPQTFLNEARLSAFALAMYLGGRLACVPSGGERLKLLVLDDVLIGLDHDNRMPILQVLLNYFSDWQVVILTHDRVWFEMAKDFFKSGSKWEWLEVKADGQNGNATPTLKVHNGDVIAEAIADANLLKIISTAAAANSARRAFEGCIRRFAEKRSLKLRFKMDPKDLSTDAFLDAIDEWIDAKLTRTALKAVVAALRAMRTGVLNPQSHDAAPNPSTPEIEQALTRIEELRTAMSNSAYN
jgi:energy-coupling factor transporter ATP-binding protein EcfA2